MTIRPEQVRALVAKLREWGYDVRSGDEQDLIDEFDTMIEEDLDGGGQHRREDPDPAIWAARAQQDTTRAQVLIAFAAAGRFGLTNDELYSAVDPGLTRDRDSWVPRVGELKRMGFVEATNETRVGRRGLQQGVHRVTLEGIALVRQRGWS